MTRLNFHKNSRLIELDKKVADKDCMIQINTIEGKVYKLYRLGMGFKKAVKDDLLFRLVAKAQVTRMPL